MKRFVLFLAAVLLLGGSAAAQSYEPTPENLRQRADFQQRRLGIFLHWGIYSTYANGICRLPESTMLPILWRPSISTP